MTHQSPTEGTRLVIFASAQHHARDLESVLRIVSTALHTFGYGAVHWRLTGAETAGEARRLIESREAAPKES